MQRSLSAVDFTALLNPTPPADSSSSSSRHTSPSHTPSATSQDTNMTAAVGIMPPQPVEDRQDLPRPYKCPLCDRAFHRLEHQTRHIRTHTGEKPHACQFPGCSKRFSRSDELTRHSRIHSNPNSRKNNKAHQVAAAAAAAVVNLQDGQHTSSSQHNNMLPPSSKGMIKSAPGSSTASPNVSPPFAFAVHNGISNNHLSPNASNYGRIEDRSNAMDINLLANAASQIEREEMSFSNQRIPYQHTHHLFSHRNGGNSGRLPSLSAYAISQSMSRSHSQDGPEDFEHRIKRSRPSSPHSTAPSSPTFSHESISPTPDHTPLATPGHSPRIRPHASDLQLPGLRHLSIGHAPLLAPMEPQADGSYAHAQQITQSGPTISDIVSGSQRKLPVPQLPKIALSDMLNPPHNLGMGESSTPTTTHGEHSK